jgi:citrate lyase subunit beta/citryl-CoA lyase
VITAEPRPRSYLYVPAYRREWVQKGWDAGADAIILDLEDSVPEGRRDESREACRDLLGQRPPAGRELWARVHPRHLEDDLAAVSQSALTGVVLPKAERSLLDATDAMLRELESHRELGVGRIRLVPLLESADGLLEVRRIAAHPRVRHLALGESDLAGELGLQPDEQRTQLWPMRLAVVLASAAAGIDRPIGPTHLRIADQEGLRHTCQTQLAQGFRARTAIHPSQVPVINAVLTPSAVEVADARAVVEAYTRAVDAGHGAARGPHGEMVDAAVVRIAYDVLSRARP